MVEVEMAMEVEVEVVEMCMLEIRDRVALSLVRYSRLDLLSRFGHRHGLAGGVSRITCFGPPVPLHSPPKPNTVAPIDCAERAMCAHTYLGCTGVAFRCSRRALC